MCILSLLETVYVHVLQYSSIDFAKACDAGSCNSVPSKFTKYTELRMFVANVAVFRVLTVVFLVI